MNDNDIRKIEQLDDDQCKAVLDFFARKAYGCGSYVVMTYMYNSSNSSNYISVVVNGIKLYLFAFKTKIRNMSVNDTPLHMYEHLHFTPSSWKTVLKTFVEYIQSKDMFISYLPDAKVMMDGYSSIYEALTSFDLEN